MLARMVQAMKAELARQCEANGDYSGPDNGQPHYLDGHYDQALVAKAALLAIREPSDWLLDQGRDAIAHVRVQQYNPQGGWVNGDKAEVSGFVWGDMIDAILNGGA